MNCFTSCDRVAQCGSSGASIRSHCQRRLLPAMIAASLVLAAVLVPAAPATATAYTWTGAFTTEWNFGLNWSPSGSNFPNSATDTAAFNGQGLGTININPSVSAQLLSFSNPTGSYTLTSNAGVSLSGVKSINVAAGVTALQTINLAIVATGSLIFPTGNNLTITNNSTTAGTTLVIGPNTVIATPGFGSVVVDGAGTTQFSGTFSTAPGVKVVGGLIKNGPGILILPNSTYSYTGGTFINNGTLQVAQGNAIPAGTNVSVQSGGQFNLGLFGNSAGTAIGTLSLNGTGTFRVPSGSSDYYLNKLTMTGGTVDFTGTSNFWLHLTGSGAGITTNASSTTANWIGDGTSRIQNDSAIAVPFSILVNPGSTTSGIDLDAGIRLSIQGTNPTFNKDGAGRMRLTNLGNGANITVNQGFLRVDDMSTNGVGALGTGLIALNGGVLEYGGPSATTTKNLTSFGSSIYLDVLTPGTNLTYSGVMGESESDTPFRFNGPAAGNPPSTLTLTNTNNFSGVTVVRNGILVIPTIADSGSPSPIGSGNEIALQSFSNFDRCSLLLAGTNANYSTNRLLQVSGSYPNGGSAIGVQNASTNLTWTGQLYSTSSVDSFIKTGDGTLTLTNTTNNYTGGTYIEAGRLHVTDDSALGAGAVSVYPSATLRYTASATVGRSIILDGGTLEAPSGISLAGGGGALQGEGTAVGDVANSGSVIPEGSTGLLHVEGNYTQSASGRLVIFMDLLSPPGDNPRLDVAGDVALDGTLQMNLGSMGQFRGTRSFDVLDWGSNLNGTTFSMLQLPMFGGAFTWDTSQLYTNGVLTLIGPPVEGDYNGDGIVDAADYTIWRDTLGSTTDLRANGDNTGASAGVIDQADYAFWKANFGNHSGSGAGATAAVPEPATAMLLLTGILTMSCHRRPKVSKTHVPMRCAI